MPEESNRASVPCRSNCFAFLRFRSSVSPGFDIFYTIPLHHQSWIARSRLTSTIGTDQIQLTAWRSRRVALCLVQVFDSPTYMCPSLRKRGSSEVRLRFFSPPRVRFRFCVAFCVQVYHKEEGGHHLPRRTRSVRRTARSSSHNLDRRRTKTPSIVFKATSKQQTSNHETQFQQALRVGGGSHGARRIGGRNEGTSIDCSSFVVVLWLAAFWQRDLLSSVWPPTVAPFRPFLPPVVVPVRLACPARSPRHPCALRRFQSPRPTGRDARDLLSTPAIHSFASIRSPFCLMACLLDASFFPSETLAEVMLATILPCMIEASKLSSCSLVVRRPFSPASPLLARHESSLFFDCRRQPRLLFGVSQAPPSWSSPRTLSPFWSRGAQALPLNRSVVSRRLDIRIKRTSFSLARSFFHSPSLILVSPWYWIGSIPTSLRSPIFPELATSCSCLKLESFSKKPDLSSTPHRYFWYPRGIGLDLSTSSRSPIFPELATSCSFVIEAQIFLNIFSELTLVDLFQIFFKVRDGSYWCCRGVLFSSCVTLVCDLRLEERAIPPPRILPRILQPRRML